VSSACASPFPAKRGEVICGAFPILLSNSYLSSFRGAPLGASPESILPMVVMDSGPAATRRPGMTTELETRLRIPAARFRVRVMPFGVPPEAEGAGNAGRSTHPQACVLKGVECTQDSQAGRNGPALPRGERRDQNSRWPARACRRCVKHEYVRSRSSSEITRPKNPHKVPSGRVLNIKAEQVDPITAGCWLLSVTESPACSRLIHVTV
jgi:hypothetical protein